MALAHTPYDGSSKPFSIGLKPLDPARWVEPDARIDEVLALKDRLFRDERATVFRQTEQSGQAQAEVLELLAGHLPLAHPEVYRRDGERLRIGGNGRSVRLDDQSVPPLERAARLVAEDLVIMQRRDGAWHLTAAALAFPSSWSLAEKFERPLDDIHAHVPDFGPGTRNAALIGRIFDNLLVEQPVWRLNWSIYPDADLFHPKRKDERPASFVPQVGPYDTFVRVERQTLRKLPVTGAILFTIRIHVDPLAAIAAHEKAAALAAGLHDQLAALTPPQVAYKGLGPTRDRLLGELRAMAGR